MSVLPEQNTEHNSPATRVRVCAAHPLAPLCSAPASSMPWGGVGAVPGPSPIKSFWLGLSQETRCPGGRESEGLTPPSCPARSLGPSGRTPSLAPQD